MPQNAKKTHQHHQHLTPRLTQRPQVVEDDIDCLQDRLARAVVAKELLELQLSEPVAASYASAAARKVGGGEPRKP